MNLLVSNVIKLSVIGSVGYFGVVSSTVNTVLTLNPFRLVLPKSSLKSQQQLLVIETDAGDADADLQSKLHENGVFQEIHRSYDGKFILGFICGFSAERVDATKDKSRYHIISNSHEFKKNLTTNQELLNFVENTEFGFVSIADASSNKTKNIDLYRS